MVAGGTGRTAFQPVGQGSRYCPRETKVNLVAIVAPSGHVGAVLAYSPGIHGTEFSDGPYPLM